MKTSLRKGESGTLIVKQGNISGCPSCRKAKQKELNINKLFRSRIKNKIYTAITSTDEQKHE